MMRRAHRAYTPNDECFFIFLDASELYLASGAEDKHGINCWYINRCPVSGLVLTGAHWLF